MQLALDAALFGDPDASRVERQTRQWQSHFNEMIADPSVPESKVAAEVIRSTLAHIAWRVTVGPSTMVAPGILVVLLGFAVAMQAASPLFSFADWSPMSGIFVALAGVLVIREASDHDRSWPTRLLWVAVILAVVGAGVDFIVNPLSSSDSIAAAATFVLSASLLPRAHSRRYTNSSWLPWAVSGLALCTVGFCNLFAASEAVDPTFERVSLALFVLELAAGLALLRAALARRATATNTPNQAVLTP